MEQIELPEINTGLYVLERMKEFGDLTAMVDGDTGETMTYPELIERTEMAAAGLQKFGIAKNDVICVISPNQFDYVVGFYASALIGSIYQPINPTYTSDDMRKAIKQCGTKFIMTSPEFIDKAKTVLKDFGQIKVIVFGESDKYPSFESLLDPSRKYVTPFCDPKNDTVALLSSSGTTGFPKPVVIPHYSVVSNTLQMMYAGLSKKGDCFVIFMPMFHLYGLCVVTYFSHCLGAKAVIMSKFDPTNYLRLIQEHRPNVLHVVPPVMVMFCKHPKLSDYDLSSVEMIQCGAAPLSQRVEEIVAKRLNVKCIYQGYGMTEVGVTHMNTMKECRHKSVGKALPMVEIKITDEDGKKVGANTEGELWIRGPQISKGYLNLPDETKNLFTEDGWVKTGDIAREDEDGFLYVIDRLKELIKYNGFQVAPAVLEDILLTYDSIADAGVVGKPDESAGELPQAYVVRRPGATVTENEILTYVAGLVAPHMKLRGGVEFVDEIPRSKSGKILRKSLRERARQSVFGSKTG